MFVKKLMLKSFRNYENETFEFFDGLNLIAGRNAQGKTNAVEAVFLLATGYSPKVKRDKQVIRYGDKSGKISAVAHTNLGEISSQIEYFSDSNKKITVNGQDTKKVSDLLGNIFAVFFNPGELKLIQEAPEDRRRFLDISISQINKQYFSDLSIYKKILNQRNNLLKEPDKETIYDTLPVWDEQFSAYAADIITARKNYVEKIAPFAKEAHSFITDGKEILDVSLFGNYPESKEEIRENISEALKLNLEKDIVLGCTSVGPHRDDLKITVNKEDVKNYGSQGQQRTAALSLKIAELNVYKERFGEYPVLILDDAMSELDTSRQQKLLAVTEGVQTIITCTDATEKCFEGKNFKIFRIEGGKIV